MSRCLSIIAAIARNGVIGNDNALPWHLPEDLKRFKALTMGHHIVMGRRTYESLGRLLPGRTTVIVSRNQNYSVPGALVADSLQAALQACGDDKEVFVIGGAQMYREALLIADRLYFTEIDADFGGDTYFPHYLKDDWCEIERNNCTSSNGLPYSYVTYQRN